MGLYHVPLWVELGRGRDDGFAVSQNQHITYIIPASLHHSLRQAYYSHSEDKAKTLGRVALCHSCSGDPGTLWNSRPSGRITLLVSGAAQALLLTTLNSINQQYIPHAVPGAM